MRKQVPIVVGHYFFKNGGKEMKCWIANLIMLMLIAVMIWTEFGLLGTIIGTGLVVLSVAIGLLMHLLAHYLVFQTWRGWSQ